MKEEQITPLSLTQRKNMRRNDGLATRSKILEVAKKMFAMNSFEEVSSKEIAKQANTNSAAVNYYFGSKEGIYEEVLIDAHNQIMNMKQLEDIILASMPPEEKLRAILLYFLKVTSNISKLWGIGVLLRAISSPSHLGVELMPTIILPKIYLLRNLIQEITSFPTDSKQLQRATSFVLLPFIAHILSPEALRNTNPQITTFGNEDTLEDMFSYCISGLYALRDKYSNM